MRNYLLLVFILYYLDYYMISKWYVLCIDKHYKCVNVQYISFMSECDINKYVSVRGVWVPWESVRCVWVPWVSAMCVRVLVSEWWGVCELWWVITTTHDTHPRCRHRIHILHYLQVGIRQPLLVRTRTGHMISCMMTTWRAPMGTIVGYHRVGLNRFRYYDELIKLMGLGFRVRVQWGFYFYVIICKFILTLYW